jgi:hypothetical protein
VPIARFFSPATFTEKEVTELNLPTGFPLVYFLDERLQVIPHPEALAPLGGVYLGDKEEVQQRISKNLHFHITAK